ncbi:MAG: oxidoreductase [Rhodoglobus sp.]|jgi:nucleoside-diphosphate-sugar epimerase|nr:oxidoreductase [Rhodoglobus sp.]
MRVFITGASGWIGSAVTDELLANGHAVLGLARSDGSAASLQAKGADVLRGDLDDLASLRAGAADSDAVIHLANKHDFAHPEISNKAERDAVEALGTALEGSHRPFVVASGVPGMLGRPGTETDVSPNHGPDSPRGGSENRALEFIDSGVSTVIARFAPTVHGAGDHGFMSAIVAAAREKGVSGYPGDGANRWPAVHRSDAARLVRLGLEDATPGLVLHAMGEEGIPSRTIAEAIGRGLGLPVESVAPDDVLAHFGWIGMFFSWDVPASSILSQQRLGWTPTGPTLIEDLDAGVYYLR